MTATDPAAEAYPSLRHEAMFYRGSEDYLAQLVGFVDAGLAVGEPVLLAVAGPHLDLVRAELGGHADRVRCADMTEIGANPGSIIPMALYAFVAAHPGRRVRIVGEPIWPERSSVEYPACVQHEALINLAFAGAAATIVCPYDAVVLHPAVLADAATTHPVLIDAGQRRASLTYAEPAAVVDAFDKPLPEVPASAITVRLAVDTLPVARRLVADHGHRAGLDPDRCVDLQVAVNEIATNSLLHTGAPATLRVWHHDGTVVCQVDDRGHLSDPLVGRIPPPADRPNGRGLLLANSLCDLLRIHNHPAGLSIRLYMSVPG